MCRIEQAFSNAYGSQETGPTGYSIALRRWSGCAVRGMDGPGISRSFTRRGTAILRQAGFGSSTALDPEFFRRTALLTCEREILEFPAEQNWFDTDNDHFHSAINVPTASRSSGSSRKSSLACQSSNVIAQVMQPSSSNGRSQERWRSRDTITATPPAAICWRYRSLRARIAHRAEQYLCWRALRRARCPHWHLTGWPRCFASRARSVSWWCLIVASSMMLAV
jgi:hypothetical protein